MLSDCSSGSLPALMWDKPFARDVTDRIEPGRTQRVTVKVREHQLAAGIWKPVELRIASSDH